MGRWLHLHFITTLWSTLQDFGTAFGVRVVLFGQLTAGNDVVATILISLFFSSVFSVFFPPLLPFLIEGVLGSKNLFIKSWPERP